MKSLLLLWRDLGTIYSSGCYCYLPLSSAKDRKANFGAMQMAQEVKSPAAKTGNQSSIPRIYRVEGGRREQTPISVSLTSIYTYYGTHACVCTYMFNKERKLGFCGEPKTKPHKRG